MLLAPVPTRGKCNVAIYQTHHLDVLLYFCRWNRLPCWYDGEVAPHRSSLLPLISRNPPVLLPSHSFDVDCFSRDLVM